MLSAVACVLFVLAGFNVTLGQVTSFDLVAFGLALVALHLVYPIAIANRRT